MATYVAPVCFNPELNLNLNFNKVSRNLGKIWPVRMTSANEKKNEQQNRFRRHDKPTKQASARTDDDTRYDTSSIVPPSRTTKTTTGDEATPIFCFCPTFHSVSTSSLCWLAVLDGTARNRRLCRTDSISGGVQRSNSQQDDDYTMKYRWDHHEVDNEQKAKVARQSQPLIPI